MLKFPEPYRVTPTSRWAKQFDPTYHTREKDGAGTFVIELSSFVNAFCIAASGLGWEHVSIRIEDFRVKGQGRTPTWNEMCQIKSWFWDKEDTVMQLHPPESDYVNVHKFVLHLWRPLDQEIPRPPKIMV